MLGALAAGLSGGASSFGESMRDVLTMQQQQRQHEDRQRIQQQQLDAQWQRMMNDSEYRSTTARLNAEARAGDLAREHERAMERSRRDAERDRQAQERWEIQQSGAADRARQDRVDRALSTSRELMRYAGQRPSPPNPSRYRPEDRALYDQDYAAWEQEVEQYDAIGRMMQKSSGLQPDEISELGLDYDQLLADINAMTTQGAGGTTPGQAMPYSGGPDARGPISRGAQIPMEDSRIMRPQINNTPVSGMGGLMGLVGSVGGAMQTRPAQSPMASGPQLTGTVSPWRQSSGTSNTQTQGLLSQDQVNQFLGTLRPGGG